MRKICNAVLSNAKEVEVCGDSTVVTIGPAQLCRTHLRKLNNERRVTVYRNKRVQVVKV